MPVTPDRYDNQNYIYEGGNGWTGDGSGGGSDSGTPSPNPWSPIPSGTVVTYSLYIEYTGSGAPSPSVDTIKKPITNGTTNTVTIKHNELAVYSSESRSQYFKHWTKNDNGTVTTYKPGRVITKTWTGDRYGTESWSGSLALYPAFESSGLFVFSPDANSNEIYYETINKSIYSPSVMLGEIFTRKGYRQIGWATSEGGTKVYDFEQSVTNGNENNVVLYPAWEHIPYKVSLHPNGATGEVVELTAYYGEDILIPDDTFTKPGYRLSVWNESEDGASSSWVAGETYTYMRDDDVDLYAVWEGEEYTVSYYEGNTLIHTSKAVYGSPFYTDRLPYPDNRAFNTFNGWIADDNTVLTKTDGWFDAYSYGADPTWLLQRNLSIYRQWSPYYGFGKVFFGGKYSDDLGIRIEEPPSYIWPEYSYEHQKVYGKNGDILRDNERYDNVSKKYKISAYDGSNFASVSKKVSEWLHRKGQNKYMRLEDSYEQDVYRLAVYEESNTLENVLATAGKSEIVFNCKPQKFLIDGDTPIPITQSGQVIVNPTDQISYPLIKLYGVGNLYINGVKLNIMQNFNYIVFDAESCNAVSAGGGNMNRYIYVLDPICLKPGNNVVTYDGAMFDISITPRWWRL